MKLIQIHEGVLELQWTWLPYWIACQPGTRAAVERELQDAVLLNGATSSAPDLEALSTFALASLKRKFPDAAAVLDAIAASPC
jgi:hypothetical protein